MNFQPPGPLSLGKIKTALEKTYCGSIGPDYRDVNEISRVVWLQEKMEACQNSPSFSAAEKKHILKTLMEAEAFERFLQDRFLGQKRFSIEGLDSMITLLDSLAHSSIENKIEELNLGMAHRGRLNVLCNFLGKDIRQILVEFEGGDATPTNIEGDVKYHKGFANEITHDGSKLRVCLLPNPSHLEAVDPVVMGFCYGRQQILGGKTQDKIVPILIHGDAAVTGQGIVAETLNLSGLPHYNTGGCIHIIANNLLGFTANPDETMSCDTCSDIFKFVRAPVLHVNADEPEAVAWCAQLAVSYRQKFASDFVIDLVGYRRHGHNETDEPGFTQPLKYKLIKDHPTAWAKYAQKLADENIQTLDESYEQMKNYRNKLQGLLDEVRAGSFKPQKTVPKALAESLVEQSFSPEMFSKPMDTAVSSKKLKSLGKNICAFPKGFTPHPKIAKLFESRLKMLESGSDFDWGMGELLAYASLASEGHPVRLTGQDCRRGTFSHRHAVLRDFETSALLETLNQAEKGQARVDVVNSPLSEVGCLGFEFGYSVAYRKSLVLWEAQFGDFSNGAQIIVDQFLVASEAKWKQSCSLVLLLPHGYEGQGPEHSSARPERFLQLCGNDNIQVANLTSPAQIFHILRRQALRDFAKPLIIMTPKSLLRHPKAVSKLADFSDGSFQEVLDDPSFVTKKKDKVSRLVVCSGKIFYDLDQAREKAEVSDTALIRIEQLYPFPEEALLEVLKGYPKASKLVWVQEEPENMGAWTFVRSRLESLDKRLILSYVGRHSSGSTAEGSLKAHNIEQSRILTRALEIQPTAVKEKKMARS